jgi:CHAD domain-containing protein
MAFRFKIDEPIEKGFRRIGAEQLERARRQVSSAADPVSEIHEARKCLKRTRALLRLGREGVGEQVFQTENARIRDISAQLAPARDDHVLRETIVALAAEAPPQLRPAIHRLKTTLLADLAQSPEPDREGALASLEDALARFRRLKIEPNEFQTLELGLARSYRRAVRHFATAYEDQSDESFHDCRKGVQSYWRHMQLLSRAWPEKFNAGVGIARELSQILGNDHDLAALKHRLTTLSADAFAPDDRTAIDQFICERQELLRRAAHPRGEMIFSERPKAFARRIAAIWSAAAVKDQADDALKAAHHQDEDVAPETLAGE